MASAIESIVKDYPKDVVWIGGDINLTDIKWSSNSISGNSFRKDINETILEALANSGLEQVVDFPTRDNNLLDIFATNRPSLVKFCKPIPGVSDHDVQCPIELCMAWFAFHLRHSLSPPWSVLQEVTT